MTKYTLIYADPPWAYRDKAADGDRGAGFKYPVMNVLDICRLPAWELAAEDCLLAMWWVPTQPLEALRVVEAWGFRLMTMKGFTWHKTNKHKGNSAIGMGHMTRANIGACAIALKKRIVTCHSQNAINEILTSWDPVGAFLSLRREANEAAASHGDPTDVFV
ncbi:MT-A70 family methyltransferase [Raoultella ornithinolytica]|uniref:MT-A70 family methyltransferase n=1 Tax=Raoultella ornithinolytica TaxID=54291 RepID=UPI0039B5497F